jgi:CheY-like chemotaxis protein
MKRVIIVDDALELGRLLSTVLTTVDSSLSVSVVPSAEEAMLESSRRPLDLLVTDVRLPGISGLDLVKKMRSRNPKLKIIIITGMADPEVITKIEALQVDAFFRKPVETPLFIEAVRQALALDTAEEMPSPPESPTRSVLPPTGRLDVPQNPDKLSTWLIGLRQSLGAQAVFVLNDTGHILVQAGDVPAGALSGEWIAPVLTALSAADKVRVLVDSERKGSVMAFRGQKFNLLLAPVGVCALGVMLRSGRASLRLPLAVEEMLEVQGELAHLLQSMLSPVEVPPTIEAVTVLPQSAPISIEEPMAAPAAEEVGLDEFAALFDTGTEVVKSQDADVFWDSLILDGNTASTNPDNISYDQARKLGLSPDDRSTIA